MYNLFLKIIQSMNLLYKKMKKLNTYWSMRYGDNSGIIGNIDDTGAFDITIDTPGTNVKLSDAGVELLNNILRIRLEYTLSSQISSGTSVKRKLCNFEISDNHKLLSGPFELMYGGLGGTGPVATHQIQCDTFTEGTNKNTLEGAIYLCGTAGGAMTTGSTFAVEFFAIAPVNMSVT